MSINDFISNFKDGARANRFRVQISWPAIVGTPVMRDDMVVEAAALPASVMGIIQVPYQGRQIPIPGDRTFEDWTMTVKNHVQFSHRNAFEKWSSLINAHEGNYQTPDSLADLVSIIDVTQLDRQNNPIKLYKLYNAWPSNIAQIDVGYDQNDTIEQYSVTFSYSHWLSPDSVNI